MLPPNNAKMCVCTKMWPKMFCVLTEFTTIGLTSEVEV